MAGKRPEPSKELLYLRKVMNQEQDADDPSDVTLKHYRLLQKDDPKWVFTQKQIAERQLEEKVDAWKAAKKISDVAQVDAPLEACEVLVQRLISEWTGQS